MSQSYFSRYIPSEKRNYFSKMSKKFTITSLKPSFSDDTVSHQTAEEHEKESDNNHADSICSKIIEEKAFAIGKFQ